MPTGRMPIPRKPLPSRAAGPAPTAGFAQPFGSARPRHSAAMAMANEAPKFSAFGGTYLGLRLIPIALLLFVFLALGARFGAEMKGLLAIILAILIAYAAFALTAGILAIKGNIVGVWMGVIEVGLSLLLGAIGMVTSEGKGIGGVTCGLGMNVLLLVLGIKALNLNKEYQQRVAWNPPGGAYPDPNYPPQAYGAQQMQHAFVPPAVNYNQPYRQRQAQQAKPVSAASPRATVLNILALAASIETEHAPARLARARTAALKLMGEKNAPEIEQVLKSQVSVVDPHARLAELGPVIAGNAKLVESLRKCLVFVLQEGQALTLAGEQFLSNYDIAVDGSVES